QADQLNRRFARGPIGQLRVEMRSTVTSESRLLRVVPLHGEQVAGPAQALEVTGIHDLRRIAVAERPDDQLQTGPPAQWRASAEQLAHDRYRRPRQQEPRAGLPRVASRAERALEP